jgi:hypothetical protein
MTTLPHPYDDEPSNGFEMTPHAVLFDTRLSAGAKVCWATLQHYWRRSDVCWPSQATLAARMSCSIGTVQSRLRELREHGFIEVRRRGLTLPNQYIRLVQPRLRLVDFSAEDLSRSRSDTQDPASQEPQDPAYKTDAEKETQKPDWPRGSRNATTRAAEEHRLDGEDLEAFEDLMATLRDLDPDVFDAKTPASFLRHHSNLVAAEFDYIRRGIEKRTDALSPVRYAYGVAESIQGGYSSAPGVPSRWSASR